MGIVALFVLGCAVGLWLFRRHTVAASGGPGPGRNRLSVIIPARNEETNLPYLLDSLRAQTRSPFEVIVVDDASDDRTRSVAESYGVKVIANPALPPGWTGKNWAVWNGYLHSSGDILVFLDADVRLAPGAFASLLDARARSGGVVSVVPFHVPKAFYEKLALVVNVLAVFAFMSPFENRNPRKGLYGSCIVTTREDYERVRGHESVRGEVLDDLNLGAKYGEAGIKVANFIGFGLVSFRMYPNGIGSAIEGIAKSAFQSTSALHPATMLLITAWFLGLIASETVFALAFTPWVVPLAAGYVLYAAQLMYFARHTGRFGWFMPAFHILSTLYFLVIMLYSVYQVVWLGRVAWKGRSVEVGGKGRQR